MAKGQKRSNREIKKPKQKKKPAKVEASFGDQVKQAGYSKTTRGKEKARPG